MKTAVSTSLRKSFSCIVNAFVYWRNYFSNEKPFISMSVRFFSIFSSSLIRKTKMPSTWSVISRRSVRGRFARYLGQVNCLGKTERWILQFGLFDGNKHSIVLFHRDSWISCQVLPHRQRQGFGRFLIALSTSAIRSESSLKEMFRCSQVMSWPSWRRKPVHLKNRCLHWAKWRTKVIGIRRFSRNWTIIAVPKRTWL